MTLGAFTLALSLLCTIAWRHPDYTAWDILPYAAITLDSSGDPVHLHDTAYGLAHAKFPPEVVIGSEMGPPDPAYRRDMASNSWHFAEQLPFYSVKPLYILILQGLVKTGLDILTSARLVSMISYGLVGMMLYLLLTESVHPIWAGVVSLAMMSNTPVFTSSILLTPDALLCAISLVGLFLIFQARRYFAGVCLLSIAPLIRPDNLILFVLVIGYLAWSVPEFSKSRALALLLVVVLVNRSLDWFAGGYGYDKLFYHSFVQRLTAPAETAVHVTAAQHVRAVASFYRNSIGSERPLFFLLGFIGLLPQYGRVESWKLCWIAVIYMILHIFLFPENSDRFLLIPFVLIVYRTSDMLIGTKRSRLAESAA